MINQRAIAFISITIFVVTFCLILEFPKENSRAPLKGGSHLEFAEGSNGEALLSKDPHYVSDKFELIMKGYEWHKDAQKVFDELRALRTYIKKTGEAEEITPTIDNELNSLALVINRHKYQQAEYRNFSTIRFLKDKILNSRPILSIDSIKNESQKDQHAKELRRKIIELMGGFPERASLNPRIVEKREFDKYRMDKILFDSEPGISVPAYILLPKGVSFPVPAIICLHQHADEHYVGKDEVVGLSGDDPEMFYAKELTERGYITLAIDARLFGERCDDEELASYLALWQGSSLLGMIVWDDIRTVDYLISRPEVDPKRIGCIGHSMGGARAVYLSALEPRIKATVVSSYVTSYRELIKKGLYHQPPSTWLPGILKYADCQDVLSLIAPRPLLIINGKEDESIPIEGMEDVFNSVKRIYEMFGAEGDLNKITFQGSHSFPIEIRRQAYQWFDKCLKD